MDDDILLDTMAGGNQDLPVAEFVAVLAPGVYELETCFGDPKHPYNAELFIGEEKDLWIKQKIYPAGRPELFKRKVELEEGVLRLRLPGHSPFTMINYVRIKRMEQESL